ncbi:zona pellucida sperm-binding protein 3 receptor-like isoform X3 [Thunnus maccoyii]|uniref:zona pellucida sperm-binding protein 3 receptor-like isoform X3 n=1 Tax=Thunnus maccoyii TaxID=8240 RepID=UPI001C4B9112|nr:zona pellucida sperm-binding protein 3 receptor-like isoform X3 [Thunnus maccoyii]
MLLSRKGHSESLNPVMGVFYFLLLSYLGLAITAQAQDCARPPVPPNVDPTTDISSQTYSPGSKVTFECQVGYRTAGGSKTITCTDGNWSPLNLKCEKKNCGSAGEVLNGDVRYPQGTSFGDTLVVVCNTGHMLVGRDKITCGNGEWDYRLPVCEAVTCDLPQTEFVGGSFNPVKDTYNYGEAVRFSCQKDYTLNGSNTISCSENAEFHPSPPTCVKVKCDEPVTPKDGYVSDRSPPPYGFKETVTFKCNNGYEMKGSSTVTCEINSTWTPFPTCTKKNCGSAGEVLNGEVRYPQGTLFGDTLEVVCNTGYRLVGRDKITCGNGGWDDRLPVCKGIEIPPKPTAATNPTTTTTTTRPFSTKKPTDRDITTNEEGNGGPSWRRNLGIAAGALGLAVLTKRLQMMERE